LIAVEGIVQVDKRTVTGWHTTKLSVISGADSAPGGSSSLLFWFHIACNRLCCTATADCLFASCSFIYTLVALVSYIDQNAIH
jgi:hypothetical protein